MMSRFAHVKIVGSPSRISPARFNRRHTNAPACTLTIIRWRRVADLFLFVDSSIGATLTTSGLAYNCSPAPS